jgi:outer membrane receptor for ferric coprogen and ferric-rhodotorulic acid
MLVRWGIAVGACLSLASLVVAEVAPSTSRRPTDIPAEELSVALQTFAKERGIQIVYESQEVNQQRTEGASGNLTIDEALTRLLNGTGLTYRYLGEDGLTIVPIAPKAKPLSRDRASGSDRRSAEQEKKELTTAREADEARPAQLEQVIVTANRRTETVQNAAMSITAVTAAEIRRRGLSGMNDYFDSVPGVSHMDIGVGRNATVIRGISLSPQDEGASSGS